MKSDGQKAYEADLSRRPLYHDGTPRKQWHELDALSQWSWNSGEAFAPAPPSGAGYGERSAT